MKTYERITDLIGGTPLMKITNYIKDNDLGADVYGKLEYFNPAGSVKDRVARAMIRHNRANERQHRHRACCRRRLKGL